MLECIDAVHGCQFAASRRPELIAVEVMGQRLLLHRLDQSCQLVASLQPFRDTQSLWGQRRSTGLKGSHALLASCDCNKVNGIGWAVSCRPTCCASAWSGVDCARKEFSALCSVPFRFGNAITEATSF